MVAYRHDVGLTLADNEAIVAWVLHRPAHRKSEHLPQVCDHNRLRWGGHFPVCLKECIYSYIPNNRVLNKRLSTSPAATSKRYPINDMQRGPHEASHMYIRVRWDSCTHPFEHKGWQNLVRLLLEIFVRQRESNFMLLLSTFVLYLCGHPIA